MKEVFSKLFLVSSVCVSQITILKAFFNVKGGRFFEDKPKVQADTVHSSII